MSGNNHFMYSLGHSTKLTTIMGVGGAVVIGGITALCAGPVATAAAIGAGIFGLLGAAGSALDASTAHGDYRASWIAGLPITAALSFGMYSGLDNNAVPPQAPAPAPSALTEEFKGASKTPTASPEINIVPRDAKQAPRHK